MTDEITLKFKKLDRAIILLTVFIEKMKLLREEIKARRKNKPLANK